MDFKNFHWCPLKGKLASNFREKKIKISIEISEIYLLPDFGGRIEVENIIWPYQVSNMVDIFRINTLLFPLKYKILTASGLVVTVND